MKEDEVEILWWYVYGKLKRVGANDVVIYEAPKEE